jgi:protein TonB
MHEPARHAPLPEVVSLDEIAAAAGVALSHVEEMAARSDLPTIAGAAGSAAFVAWADAVAAVRELTGTAAFEAFEAPLFTIPPGLQRSAGFSLAGSSVVHAAVFVAAFALTTVGLTPAAPVVDVALAPAPARLVFLATAGPGGGGGGGGLRQPTPSSRAERAGRALVSSPVPPRRAPLAALALPRAPAVPLDAEALPPLMAPVAEMAAENDDRPGLPDAAPEPPDSRGSGEDGGVGSGSGTGIGEGDGRGIGPGVGGGTGGGPYRPGSGITPPQLLREVKPDYTEAARQRGVQGEVILEIVVRHDGSVGDIRLAQGLGFGLDERAIAAVRQWRFSPAERQGIAVDVLVEVAVEFGLR